MRLALYLRLLVTTALSSTHSATRSRSNVGSCRPVVALSSFPPMSCGWLFSSRDFRVSVKGRHEAPILTHD
jgi:hypothetical protein